MRLSTQNSPTLDMGTISLPVSTLLLGMVVVVKFDDADGILEMYLDYTQTDYFQIHTMILNIN